MAHITDLLQAEPESGCLKKINEFSFLFFPGESGSHRGFSSDQLLLCLVASRTQQC